MSQVKIPDYKQFKTIIERSSTQKKKLFEEAQHPEAWIKSRKNPRLSQAWKQINGSAERYINLPIEIPLYSEFVTFHFTGERKVYEEKAFERMRRLHSFALMMLSEPEETKWQIQLEDTIWAICNEYTWVVPAHVGLYNNQYPNGIWEESKPPRETVDLFAALTAFSLSEIVGMLGTRLSPWIVHRVKQEVDRRIFQVYFYDPVPQNWELKTNNWPAVCASGIGIAALYLVEDSERLTGMLWRVIAALQNHLKGFDSEGATSEGVGYWQFGFGYFTYFAEMLREWTDGEINLLDDDFIRRVAEFPGACFLSGGKVLNFSDAPGEMPFVIGLFEQLKRHFDSVVVPNQQVDIEPYLHYWAHTTRTLLWVEAEKESSPVLANGHHDYMFNGHQWVISKTVENERVMVFAAKGGHNAEPHNHNDLGHFIVHVNGDSVLADLGAGEYTRQYFQPDTRYETITCGSQGHSVPVVDGCRQGTGKEYGASVLQYEASEDRVHYRLDLTKAYPSESLHYLERNFTWIRQDQRCFELKVEDEARFDSVPEHFEEAFVTFHTPHQIIAGKVKIGPVTMCYSPDQFDYHYELHEYRMLNGERTTAYRIILTCKTMSMDMKLGVVFTIEN